MDPLSISASIAALLQITAKITKYLSLVNGAAGDRQRILSEICSMNCLLYSLQDRATLEESPWTLISRSLNAPNGPFTLCKDTLLILLEKLKPVKGRQKIGKAMAWPFGKDEVHELLSTLERQKSMFSLALQQDHLRLSEAIKGEVMKVHNEVDGISNQMAEMHTSQSQMMIKQWLRAPDPSLNHYTALRDRCASTGVWLLKEKTFKEWKLTSGSFLWLHGIPGCGKTVLSSSIIEHLIQESCSKPGQAVLYFYFDFKDAEKQQHGNLIRSLIQQIWMQQRDLPQALKGLYSSCGTGQQQPTHEKLLVTLHQIMRTMKGTYLILDALDECEERQDLLDDIQELGRWKDANLQILVTSRRVKDIEESITLANGDVQKFCIQGPFVHDDIREYVKSRMQNDRSLRRWRKDLQVQQEIENTLVNKANGMFRWAACQLDQLRSSLSVFELRQSLAALPKDLDSAYSHILSKIPKERARDVLKVLQWLACSVQPLQLREVAELVTINVQEDPRVNVQKRFQEPQEVLTICSSLITYSGEILRDTTTVQLAHFSVKEYLLSTRILQGKANAYGFSDLQANVSVANDCVAYLMQFDNLHSVTGSTYSEFPLSSYAALYWFRHARKAEEDPETAANSLVGGFFLTKGNALLNWVRLHDPDGNFAHMFGENMQDIQDVASPLYYASLFGLTRLVGTLLEKGESMEQNVGYYGNPLQAASSRNHSKTMKLLIDRGMDINARGGHFGSALQAASSEGHYEAVTTLVSHGADVNASSGPYWSNLQVACVHGYDRVVQILISHGADVNASGGEFGNALYAASEYGYDRVVQILISHGADVDALGGPFGNALRAASARGHDRVVQILMSHGAHIER